MAKLSRTAQARQRGRQMTAWRVSAGVIGLASFCGVALYYLRNLQFLSELTNISTHLASINEKLKLLNNDTWTLSNDTREPKGITASLRTIAEALQLLYKNPPPIQVHGKGGIDCPVRVVRPTDTPSGTRPGNTPAQGSEQTQTQDTGRSGPTQEPTPEPDTRRSSNTLVPWRETKWE